MSSGKTIQRCGTLIVKTKTIDNSGAVSDMMNRMYEPFTLVNVEFIPLPKYFSLHVKLTKYCMVITLKKHMNISFCKELYEITVKRKDGEYQIETDAYEEDLAEGFIYRLKKVDDGTIIIYSFGDEDVFEEPDYECDERFCIGNMSLCLNECLVFYGQKSGLNFR